MRKVSSRKRNASVLTTHYSPLTTTYSAASAAPATDTETFGLWYPQLAQAECGFFADPH
ncbi:MAG TPA: hypothetical protein PK402_11965 [Tepidisphaeraceae bacterium]|nr:hypothetical protein [Tepidisphaeraceae bacterium]